MLSSNNKLDIPSRSGTNSDEVKILTIHDVQDIVKESPIKPDEDEETFKKREDLTGKLLKTSK